MHCYIMSIMMSIICLPWCSYLQRLLPQHQWVRVCFGYYQVVIVSLDCSSDILQIKLNGDILSLVTRSLMKKGLMCGMLIVYIITVLKVTRKVRRVRGCHTIGVAFIYCITEKATVQKCFALIFIHSMFSSPGSAYISQESCSEVY